MEDFFIMVLKRNIGLAIVLSIVTCGIYSLYWLVCMANDLNSATGEQDTSGGLVLVFTIITCGIYGWYWMYKAGEKIRKAQTERNFSYISDSGVVYIILSVVGLSIVAYALIQSELNKIAEYDERSINV